MTIEETNGERAGIELPAGAPAQGPAPQHPAGSEARPPQAPWRMGAARAGLIFACYVAVQFAVGLVLGIGATVVYLVRHGTTRNAVLPVDLTRWVVMTGGVTGMIAAAAVAYWLAKRAARREPGLFRALGWSRTTPRVSAFAVLWGVALGLAFLALFAVFPPPQDFHPGAILDALDAGGWVVAGWVAIAVAIAPPVEEFVFRGILWTGLSRSWSAGAAGSVVTLVFVALHLPETHLYVPAIAAISGLALSTLAIRTLSGSLAPAVLLHASYNGVMVLSFFAGLAAK